ncbi:hypothetical protein SAMN06265222_1552 [Neorhodopirellula lusitana]|uniref:HNH endonuclease n=1 Tax=Neorhodopirellula lusitana TaxID=445327 RepID=A0ABY1QU43_9BACT|nr:hypothetical protein [Neorhodopirellula lusitana]SMP80500.1 hypothetical protein SAMN06265222_1552 [Neorhodopirellula lusitana]
MTKPPRKAAKSDVSAGLLVATRRRCCLCVYLANDTSRKRVQIAHIDGDRSNSTEPNLVPLCLDHHDEYDSTTRLSKGLAEKEIKLYKQRLIQQIASAELDFGPVPLAPQCLESEAEGDAFAYGLLFADISRVVAAHDPVGFISLGNEDEYDLEIDDIIFVVSHSEPAELAKELEGVFAHWFTDGVAAQFDHYAELARDILNAMHLNRERNPVYNPVYDPATDG